MGNIFMPLTLDVWLLTILLVTFCGLVVWAMEDRASLSRAHPSVARPRARVHKHMNIRTHGLLIWSRTLVESAARHAVSSFLLQSLQNGPLTPISPARAPVGPTPAVKAVELEG